MKYGYIGLGSLGGHLAMSLIKAGHDVVVYDLDAKLAERHVEAGAKRAATVAELVKVGAVTVRVAAAGFE